MTDRERSSLPSMEEKQPAVPTSQGRPHTVGLEESGYHLLLLPSSTHPAIGIQKFSQTRERMQIHRKEI